MNRVTFTKLAAVPIMCVAVLYAGVATQGQTAPQKTTTSKAKTRQGGPRPEQSVRRGAPGASGRGRSDAKKIIAGRPYAKIDDLAKAGVPARVIEAIRQSSSAWAALRQPSPSPGPPRLRRKPRAR